MKNLLNFLPLVFLYWKNKSKLEFANGPCQQYRPDEVSPILPVNPACKSRNSAQPPSSRWSHGEHSVLKRQPHRALPVAGGQSNSKVPKNSFKNIFRKSSIFPAYRNHTVDDFRLQIGLGNFPQLMKHNCHQLFCRENFPCASVFNLKNFNKLLKFSRYFLKTWYQDLYSNLKYKLIIWKYP